MEDRLAHLERVEAAWKETMQYLDRLQEKGALPSRFLGFNLGEAAVRYIEELKARPAWRCFHCDEVFHDQQSAEDHFGASLDAKPLCQVSVFHRGLGRALRAAEKEVADAWAALHAESADAVKAMQRMVGRHNAAVIAAEEAGYAKGVADARDNDKVCERVFLAGHAEGWTGNQMRRDVQHVDAAKGWNLYVSNGALAKAREAS